MSPLIAGPFAGMTLAEFGADVIKIEPPGACDPLRNWRMIKDGRSVRWRVQSRNKRSIALDLRSPEGQDIARRLIRDSDVLITGNCDSIFKRLMQAIGRDDLGKDPALANNAGRVTRVTEIDAAIDAWTMPQTVQQVLDRLGDARVPAGTVYTVKDIVEDPHFRARKVVA
jgi:crotonobetainyl-CoA:carnitine CoA-transferase CaiB-like acyl-CoA transferase